MIDGCETEYLVPLDSDMVLYPGFYDRIASAVKLNENDPKWHSILFPLYDTLTAEKIMALKVFRTPIIKQFRYKNNPCPDISHYKDLTEAGHTTVSMMGEREIGDHVVRGDFFCYAKYRDLYSVLREYPDSVLESHFKGGTDLASRARNHFEFFLDSLGATGNRDYLYCVAGMVEGLTSTLRRGSKDLSDKTMRVPVGDAVVRFKKWSREMDPKKVVF